MCSLGAVRETLLGQLPQSEHWTWGQTVEQFTGGVELVLKEHVQPDPDLGPLRVRVQMNQIVDADVSRFNEFMLEFAGVSCACVCACVRVCVCACVCDVRTPPSSSRITALARAR